MSKERNKSVAGFFWNTEVISWRNTEQEFELRNMAQQRYTNIIWVLLNKRLLSNWDWTKGFSPTGLNMLIFNFFRCPVVSDVFEHSLQWYYFSPKWVFWCFFRLPGTENILGHCLQEYDFSIEWVLWWFLRLPASEKVLWHTLQGYGFSPEWVLLWFINLPALENVLEHSLQGHVLSPECVLNVSYSYQLQKMSSVATVYQISDILLQVAQAQMLPEFLAGPDHRAPVVFLFFHRLL